LDQLVAERPAPAQWGTGAASVTGRRWIWRSTEDRLGFAIAERLDVPEIVGRIMAARGIGIADAADFLTPTLRALLPDPSVLTDMEAAADRLARAVRAGETVAVFGDYDVDGACSAAILALFLRGLGCSVLPYVPDRLAEGYGPNAAALTGLIARGATLILCVDCGTAAADVFGKLAGSADIVVLDHHKAEGPPPPVLATVNPNRLDCASGLRHLCAAGVAFMTSVAVLRRLRRDGALAGRDAPDLMQLLDLVALATVCDVMPLTGLNRALVAQGLRIMGRRERPGLAALMDVAKTRDLPTAMTCGFGLGPRLNAGGRISEADLGLRLLLCEDPLEARLLAERLDAINRQRQMVEAGVLADAAAAAEAQAEAGHEVLLVCGAGWHPGVVGIVAGRLKETFNRPVCVGGLSGGIVKGSGRSVPGVDLGAAVIAARQSGLLLSGGGHAMAAGFGLAPEREAAFTDFLRVRLPRPPGTPRRPHLAVDASVAAAGASLDLARQLARLAPFGTGNEEPVIVVPDVRVVKTDRLGNDGNTLRAYVQGEGGGLRLKCMLFRAGDGPLAQTLTDRLGGRLHLAGHLRAEHWNGTDSVSLCVVDAAQSLD
jgi:single-stranded-DNA-specific exonuclease